MLARTGSVKRGTVSIDLADERAKCNFDQEEMMRFFYDSPEKLEAIKEVMRLGSDPELINTLEFYDMTPHEMQKDLWRRMKVAIEKYGKHYFEKSVMDAPFVDPFGYF